MYFLNVRNSLAGGPTMDNSLIEQQRHSCSRWPINFCHSNILIVSTRPVQKFITMNCIFGEQWHNQGNHPLDENEQIIIKLVVSGQVCDERWQSLDFFKLILFAYVTSCSHDLFKKKYRPFRMPQGWYLALCWMPFIPINELSAFFPPFHIPTRHWSGILVIRLWL